MDAQWRVGAGGGLWRGLVITLLAVMVGYLALGARPSPGGMAVAEVATAQPTAMSTPATTPQIIQVILVLPGADAAPTPTATATAEPEAAGSRIYLVFVAR